MLDQSLLQSHFIGRDGFRWWIGQIAPIDVWREQVEGGGWSNRFKVRIFGYHPYNPDDLPNEDLPWAQALVPTTAGTGSSNCMTGVQLQPGDVVLGFFLDGDNAQIPAILAAFGNTTQRASSEYKFPFQPFTGYNDLIPVNPGTPRSESNEINSVAGVQPTPPDRSQSDLPANEAIGNTIPLANTVKNTQLEKIKAAVKNLLNKLKKLQGDIENIRVKISETADKIVNIANDIVGGLFQTLLYGNKDGTFPGLIPVLQQGLQLLYDTVFAKVLAATGSEPIAYSAGVLAQQAMAIPTKKLEEAFSCVASSVVNSLKSVVVDLLESVVSNVDRFVTCAAEQFSGVFINTIINTIESFMEGPLELVSTLLQFFSDFNVGNLLRSGVDALSDFAIGFACNQNLDSFTDLVNNWVIGSGPIANTLLFYDNVQDIADVVNSGAEAIQDCFTDALDIASPPTITIFGGRGSGATAVPIFGNIDTDASGNLIGSVIGVKVTNPGSGYAFPPFIEISDDNDQGYGAIARTLINEKGEVTSIYIVSEGENYTVGNISEYSILDVYVQSGGQKYDDAEVVDNAGNKYEVQIVDGRIYQVTPLNNTITTLPFLQVKSNTGTGAILRPILGDVKMTGEVQTSIDCPI